jgi:hypothetical protein
MNRTPPPPKRNKLLTYPGTPLPFNQNNNDNPRFHMYENKNTRNTPKTPIKMSRKRTRINMNNYQSNNNHNNNRNSNNNTIPPQKVISNKVKSLREECDEHIKQIDLEHELLIENILRDKRNEIYNIDKKYSELIDKTTKKYEEIRIKKINGCKEIEKTVIYQESGRKPLKRTLFKRREH